MSPGNKQYRASSRAVCSASTLVVLLALLCCQPQNANGQPQFQNPQSPTIGFPESYPTDSQQPTGNLREDFQRTARQAQINHPVTTASYTPKPAERGDANVGARPIAPPTETLGGDHKRSSSPLGMFMSLLFVVGLIFGVTWVAKKTGLINSGLQSAIGDDVVEVIGRKPLGARQHLLVIKFGSKVLLVNNFQGETRTLSEISDPAEVRRLCQQVSVQSPEPTISLRGLLGGRSS